MALRVVLDDGVVVESDTADEAAALVVALRKQSAKSQQPLAAPSVQSTLLDGFFPKATSYPAPAGVIFKNGDSRVFGELMTVAGVTTERMVELLGLPSPKSIPPIIGAWAKRARAIGLNLGELLLVNRRFSDGKATTIYRFTDKGREILSPGVDTAQVVTDSGD